MASDTIDHLIVNSPYVEPSQHWSYDRSARHFDLKQGRRPAGYLIATQDSRTFDDPGTFVAIPLVNQIRRRVKEWRIADYPGATGITRRLLTYWSDPEEFDSRRFFFCQIEAAETLMWLTEAPDADKVGIDILGDGGSFRRLCAKMATGTGKTVVMAMILAWHILNKIANPTDKRYSKNILVVAPGLTVRDRLAVLTPSHPENYYDAFRIVPPALSDMLHRGRVIIRNWHALNWETEEHIARRRSVDKRGAKSDEAYVREVLGEIARSRNILVINDEAHHAWRIPTNSKVRGIAKAAIDEATKWVGGLDRIHRARGIRVCYDFSATPFAPSGRRVSQESLFEWIVSDFGLNDAIESGLVKTPRVVIHDDALPDAKTYKSRLYHIYNDDEVKNDLNRKAPANAPLPSLVTNGYHLLGYDWRETDKTWTNHGATTPPVMITVANRTETAARIKHAFDKGMISIPELCNPATTLHIDSKVLSQAEAAEGQVLTKGASPARRPNKKQAAAERLREAVNTVGKPGKPGEKIQHVISVGMLSEGWDAKTVTHIMGLRAFSSQLLCEQVVGRGLRRTSYDVNPKTGQFEPEYVNIFGIPFSFLPHEKRDVPPPPDNPKTAIQAVAEKVEFEIEWPNVVRIEHGLRPQLSLDADSLDALTIDTSQTAIQADLARFVEGKPERTNLKQIDLEALGREYRMQRIVFETVRRTFDQMRPDWRGGRVLLLAQLVRVIEVYLRTDAIRLMPESPKSDDSKRRLIIMLNLPKVVQHIWQAIRFQNVKTLTPILDQDRPILSTGDMRLWYTGRACGPARKSHINFCVYDSTWEESDAYILDHSESVKAWAKNDHLGFEVYYIHKGVVRKYRPDFLVRLSSDEMLVLETKGIMNEEAKVKQRFLEEWIRAVNAHGGFGRWHCAVSTQPNELKSTLERLVQKNHA